MTLFDRLFTTFFRYTRQGPYVFLKGFPPTNEGGFRIQLCGFKAGVLVTFQVQYLYSHLFKGPRRAYCDTFGVTANENGCIDYPYDQAPISYCPSDPLAAFEIKYRQLPSEPWSKPRYYDCQGRRIAWPPVVQERC